MGPKRLTLVWESLPDKQVRTSPQHILRLQDVLRTAAAPAKSLQSCPTLCDPIDGSPPGSPVPGTLQARTLEWAPSQPEWKIGFQGHAAESSSASSQRVVVTTLLPQNRERVPKMLLLEQNWLPCSFHDSAWIPSSRLKNCVGEKNATHS